MNGAPRLKRQPKGIYPGMGAGSGSGGIYISPSRHPAYSPILPEDIGGIGFAPGNPFGAPGKRKSQLSAQGCWHPGSVILQTELSWWWGPGQHLLQKELGGEARQPAHPG